MKLHNKIFIGTVLAIATSIGLGSCTDDIAFGNSFLEKAPGGSVTEDTVFNNPEYTRQFLAGVYSLQYYGLPWRSSSDAPLTASYWNGEVEALSDCYQLYFQSSMLYKQYYTGAYTASSGSGVYGFLTENVWVLVRRAYLIIENINRVPNMEQTEKDRITAEAKCLIASAYFNMFRHYGGLPLIKSSFSGTESSYQLPRASVKNTVNFMVGLLDEAINTSALTWAYSSDEASSETGHWTKAGAMALKCKILQFAASPLFNATQGYYGGTTEAEKDSLAWYGDYDKSRWTACKNACKAFFDALSTNGGYALVQPTENTQEGYRYAYRSAYWNETSTEILHSVRVTNSTRDSKYQWLYLRGNDRLSYNLTAEYGEMFPWADGTPFDWNKDSIAGKLDHMFVKGDTVAKLQLLQNRVYTRDPRLYETADVNGALQGINDANGSTTGANYEIWVGGTQGGTNQKNETGCYATGYRLNKYVVGDIMYTSLHYPQWDVLRLSDIYLTYAEALLQSDDNYTDALKYVDAVRARVGLKGLAECNPTKNLTSNKANLLEEILRERACELGFEDTRYFDMVRYKRSDLFEKKLHGLRIYRLMKNSSGQWERSATQWYNGDRKTAKQGQPSYYEPSHFDYERFVITNGAREWWNGYDKKWFLQPFPTTEVNKGYGLIQNPGW
jgi:hypothetical protein